MKSVGTLHGVPSPDMLNDLTDMQCPGIDLNLQDRILAMPGRMML